MKKIFSSFFVVIAFGCIAIAQEKEVPSELKPFILQGYEVLDFIKEDLNSDKLTDYILILRSKGEDTLTFDNPDWDVPRPLLLLIRQTNDQLKLAAENTKIIYCRHCGGAMGDPYQGVLFKNGDLLFDFYGGSSWRWAETITFRYNKVKKNWFLQNHFISSFQAGDPDNTTTETTIGRAETGEISLQNYFPYYNQDSSSWKVKTVKTYFYESPDLKSKPKKAYLIKGDIVRSSKSFTNFIDCFFTNSRGQITTGYILKKDLLLLPARKTKAVQ